MERAGSDMDMNGQRPRTPSSGDNEPSPSKRPRLDGQQFANPQMMPNGRMPAQGMPGQQLMNYNMNEASGMLLQNNINPNNLSPQQMESFQASNPQVRKKSIQVYNANMAQQVRNAMPQSGMTTQGSPMMQAGMDVHANADYYGAGNRMGGAQGQNAGGNHALQDYQMQLMLLEQQNKKRLLMARQEQDNNNMRPDGQPGLQGQQQGFTPGMSPQGSRSGPSPNPSDQIKRGTPKLGQTGLPGSPLPDGSMAHIRGSPGPMTYGQMPAEMLMKNMDGMPVGPGANGMRPPGSHQQFPNGQMVQHMEAMRAQAQNGARMPNGANWQQGPQGQAPMMPQASQGQPQMGTPQQRNAMPPPQGIPAGGAANGRPASPAQSAAPPTPQQANKGNPKGKKEGEKPRKVRRLGRSSHWPRLTRPSDRQRKARWRLRRLPRMRKTPHPLRPHRLPSLPCMPSLSMIKSVTDHLKGPIHRPPPTCQRLQRLLRSHHKTSVSLASLTTWRPLIT